MKRSWRRLLATGVLAIVVTSAACSGGLKAGPSGPRIMVIGDSIMHQLAPYIDGATGDAPFQRASFPGCPVVRGQVLDWNGNPIGVDACNDTIWRAHQEFLDSFDPDIVVWLSSWELSPRNVNGTVFTPGSCTWGQPPGSLCGNAGDNALINAMNEKVAHLTSRGARLVMVTVPPPTQASPGSPPNGHWFQAPVRLDIRTEHLNVLLRYVASRHGIRVADLASRACPPSGRPPCPKAIQGVPSPLRPDGAHFREPEGAMWAAATLAQMILG